MDSPIIMPIPVRPISSCGCLFEPMVQMEQHEKRNMSKFILVNVGIAIIGLMCIMAGFVVHYILPFGICITALGFTIGCIYWTESNAEEYFRPWIVSNNATLNLNA